MKIRWIGHACFSIESENGRIVTDPFAADVPYPFPAVAADIVTVSREHSDHNAVSRLLGDPAAVREVGGHYTIDASTAAGIVRQLTDVRVVFPMHYQTGLIASWPIAPVEAFLQTMDNVRHIGSSDIVLTRATLPETVEVWVQNHA